ncbi:MAG: hypothetical protein VB858_04760, partial [Planctomycetaceae bacterium]
MVVPTVIPLTGSRLTRSIPAGETGHDFDPDCFVPRSNLILPAFSTSANIPTQIAKTYPASE